MEQMTINITPANGGYIATVHTAENGVAHQSKPTIFTTIEALHAFLVETASEPAAEPEAPAAAAQDQAVPAPAEPEPGEAPAE